MNAPEVRQAIQIALAGFAAKPLAAAAIGLFESLGYRSERRLTFPSLATCLAEFDREGKAAKHFPGMFSTFIHDY
jgi:hypothetical protein